MPLQICEHELTKLTDFQKEIHTLDLNRSKDEDGINDPFNSSFTKILCYSMSKIKMTSVDQGSYKSFSLDCTLHLLADSYLIMRTPTIEVKPECQDFVRIAFCHNLMHNIIEEARFEEDGLVFNNFDNYWYDIHLQFLKNYQGDIHSKRIKYSKCIGNIPLLENFSTKLVSVELACPQPFFYSNDTGCSYPIYKKGSLSRARHTFKFNLDVSKLLRIQCRKRKPDSNSYTEWVDFSVNTVDLKSIITVKGEIAQPELYGCYVNYAQNAYSFYANDGCDNSKDQINELYITDMITFDSSKSYSYGETAEPTTLKNINPCLALFWMAENLDAKKYNNHSNYTTNTFSIEKGHDPISKHSLSLNSQAKFNNYSSIHFNSIDPMRHFPTVPFENGYFGSSFCWFIPREGIDYGVTFKDDRLLCYLEDTDPNIDDHKLSIDQLINAENYSSEKERDRPKFRLICRGLILRKISYEKDNSGQIKISIDKVIKHKSKDDN